MQWTLHGELNVMTVDGGEGGSHDGHQSPSVLLFIFFFFLFPVEIIVTTIRTVDRRLINHWARRRHFLLSTSAERRLLFPSLSIIIFLLYILTRDFPTVEKASAIDHAPTAVRPIVFFFLFFILFISLSFSSLVELTAAAAV
jgi:hypothetical protein